MLYHFVLFFASNIRKIPWLCIKHAQQGTVQFSVLVLAYMIIATEKCLVQISSLDDDEVLSASMEKNRDH